MLFKQFLPPDADQLDMEILDQIAFNIYQSLPDVLDKFIVMSVFELHNTKKETASLLGVSYDTVWARIHYIRGQIDPKYRLPNRLLKVSKENLVKF